ncbi:MAG TPA: ABC transporter permease, partial [Stellaceae bacterium]|nr:ABC transporter permease [Stellaceae bacterium]
MSAAGLFFTSLLASTVRLAAPLILAALAGLYAERSGVVDIGLEGKLLFGAFAGAAIAALSGSAASGLAAAIAAGLLLSMLHGWFSIALGGDQIVSGMALNLVAAGAAPSLAAAWFHQGGATPPLAAGARFAAIALPLAGPLGGLPIVGPIYRDVLSGQSLFVYLAWLAVPATACILGRTRWGLRLRAVGESPQAVAASGISVGGMRWGALAVGGALCGIGG